eukprot:552012_1
MMKQEKLISSLVGILCNFYTYVRLYRPQKKKRKSYSLFGDSDSDIDDPLFGSFTKPRNVLNIGINMFIKILKCKYNSHRQKLFQNEFMFFLETCFDKKNEIQYTKLMTLLTLLFGGLTIENIDIIINDIPTLEKMLYSIKHNDNIIMKLLESCNNGQRKQLITKMIDIDKHNFMTDYSKSLMNEIVFILLKNSQHILCEEFKSAFCRPPIKSIFHSCDDDDELFTNKKSSMFDSDFDDDLFSGKSKIKTSPHKKKSHSFSSIFGDSDGDDSNGIKIDAKKKKEEIKQKKIEYDLFGDSSSDYDIEKKIEDNILSLLKDIGCEIHSKSFSEIEWNASLCVETIVKCLHKIDDIKFAHLSGKLDNSKAKQFQFGRLIAKACKELGYHGEIEYTNIIYPNNTDMKCILQFLTLKICNIK